MPLQNYWHTYGWGRQDPLSEGDMPWLIDNPSKHICPEQPPYHLLLQTNLYTHHIPRRLLILGGDFNVSLNSLQDTSNGAFSLPYKALRSIKSQLQDLLLHDSWRTLNPNGRDFTFFSNPHQWYSRIDYLFISQKDLSYISERPSQTTTLYPCLYWSHRYIITPWLGD